MEGASSIHVQVIRLKGIFYISLKCPLFAALYVPDNRSIYVQGELFVHDYWFGVNVHICIHTAFTRAMKAVNL